SPASLSSALGSVGSRNRRRTMMRWLPTAMVMIAATGTLFGCTQFAAYRTKTITSTPTAIMYEAVDCFSGRNKPTIAGCEEEGPAAYAIQHRHYRYQNQKRDGGVEARIADYHMAFVEFDDQ